MKSNLTAERWFSDPLFAGSRNSAANFARASELASEFYKTIPLQQRKFAQYRRLVGIAQHKLSVGYSIPLLRETLEHRVKRICQQQAYNGSGELNANKTFAIRSCLRRKSASLFPLLFKSLSWSTGFQAAAQLWQPGVPLRHSSLVYPLIVDPRSRGRPNNAVFTKAPSVRLVVFPFH